MSMTFEMLIKRAEKLNWNLEKLDRGNYKLWENIEGEENKVQHMNSLENISKFLNDKKPKKEIRYNKSFRDESYTVKRLGYTLYKEDWWDMMGIRYLYKVVIDDNIKPIRFKSLIQVDDWCKLQKPSKKLEEK
jgi:hypothetical protein